MTYGPTRTPPVAQQFPQNVYESHIPHHSPQVNAQEIIEKAVAMFAKVQEMFAKFSQEHPNGISQRSVVLLGRSGVGKTTLLHALSGSKLIVHYDKSLAKWYVTADPEIPGFEIGLKRTSQTSIPRVHICKNLENTEEVCVVDFPGLDDNRSISQEIFNALCMQKVLEKQPAVKFLVLINQEDILDQKANKLMEFLSILEHMLSANIDSIGSSISLVVTHADTDITADQIRNNVDEIMDQLNVSGNKRLLLERMTRKIAFLRNPQRISEKFLNTTETVSNVFKNIHASNYVSGIAPKVGLSTKALLEARTTLTTLVAYIHEHVESVSKKYLDNLKAYLKKTTDGVSDRNSIQDALSHVTTLSEKLALMHVTNNDPLQLGNFFSTCKEISQICGSDLLFEDLAPKIELARNFSCIIDENISFAFDATISSAIEETRLAVEASQSKLNASLAESDKKRLEDAAEKTEKETLRNAIEIEKIHQKGKQQELMYTLLGKVVENGFNLVTESVKSSKNKSSEKKPTRNLSRVSDTSNSSPSVRRTNRSSANSQAHQAPSSPSGSQHMLRNKKSSRIHVKL
jgi:GTPase SAR1 family protein